MYRLKLVQLFIALTGGLFFLLLCGGASEFVVFPKNLFGQPIDSFQMTFAGLLTIRISLSLTKKVVLFSIRKMTGFFKYLLLFKYQVLGFQMKFFLRLKWFCAFYFFHLKFWFFLQKIVSLEIVAQFVTCVPQVDWSSWFNGIKWAINLEH